MAIDERIVKLGIVIGKNVRWYEDLNITATGTRFASPDCGSAKITISNLNRETREFLQRECAPNIKSNVRKSIILNAGRESYGTTTLFRADIRRIKVTQPPDIGLELNCIPNSFNKGIIIPLSYPAETNLSVIAQEVANANGLGLSFEIEDKKTASFEHSGSAADALMKLQKLTGADVYEENNTLFVVAKDQKRRGGTVRILNKDTGMIGIPESTENGVKVTMLFDPVTKIKSTLRLESDISPQLNGDYIIYKLDYNITNRDVPFYLTAEANFAKGRL